MTVRAFFFQINYTMWLKFSAIEFYALSRFQIGFTWQNDEYYTISKSTKMFFLLLLGIRIGIAKLRVMWYERKLNTKVNLQRKKSKFPKE